MHTVLNICLTVAALMLLIPVVTITLQIVSAALLQRKKTSIEPSRQRVAVLIPAHNESTAIIPTIRSITPQLQEGDRLLVVADNCTDNTAEIARQEGAEVVIRIEPEHRGKGYALDWGVKYLAQYSPDTVVFIDADCVLAPGSLDHLRAAAQHYGRPVQALDLMLAPTHSSVKMRFAQFAWAIKNHARPLGYFNLGLPCQLMGTGMAIPSKILSNMSIASGHITEDLQLGLRLTEKGFPPTFCPEALVTSMFPSDSTSQLTQRTRWERGHLSLIFDTGLHYLVKAIKNRDLKLLAMVIDLCVPPLTLLAALTLAVTLTAMVELFSTGFSAALLISLTEMVLLVGSVLLAQISFGRSIVSFRDLFTIPMLIATKIPFYLRMAFQKPSGWIRTNRDSKKK